MDLKKLWGKRRGGSLVENTIMLYILQFSNMFLGIISRGIQTRVLDDKSVYGTLVVAQSVMTYFQLFLDFGFILSATAKISKHRSDRDYLNKILTCVVCIKLCFTVLSVVVLALFFSAQPGEFLIYFIFLASTVFNALLPDYMYRGLERMSAITVRTVSVKLFATLMIAVFMRGNEDAYMVPLFTAVGNFGALVCVYLHLFKKVGVGFTRVGWRDILTELRESAAFFVSRIASTVYGAANTQVLALVDPTKTLSSIYSSAETISSTAKSAMSPISDSLYPHMMRSRNFKLIKKTLVIFMPLILLCSAILFVFAQPICVLVFGSGYTESALALRALLPSIIFTFPNYILGVPTLGAIGLAQYVNLTTILGTVFHVLGLAALFATHSLTMVTLCLLTGCTELLVLAIRVVIIWKNRRLLRQEEGSQ